MIIKNYFLTNETEVKNKKFNIYIGISVRNNYFSEEHIKRYLDWALENTNEKVAILIADEIQAINDEIFFNLSKDSAKKTAFKKGSQVKRLCEKIIAKYLQDIQKKIIIVRWKDVINSFDYKKNRCLIFDEFNTNILFRNYVLNYIKNLFSDKSFTLNELEKLSEYYLSELSVFLNGFIFENIHYNLLPYPAIGLFEFVCKLKKGLIFPELSKKLFIKTKTAYIEGYV
ncbi:tRNA-dependent cyclodipeptide synthase [archaeon]|nr:tRNA-dependent cyclodipeptide synthase [archaeon]NCP79044.1 tRNA-dependent cyclodipeptide synthase [archaeon]NCP97573.1 tRNA-dependent cyclodipeptide synthase [archaeon]NCQ06811.1 tRNA-dependent cyclodipeptide synthase [archaeon]NCQ50607.1 tRNA-dependent cyclodipeptide synthase [archaeon]